MKNKLIVTAIAGMIAASMAYFIISKRHDHHADRHSHGHDHSHRPASHGISGKETAVKEFCDEDGLVLSQEAIHIIGLKTVQIRDVSRADGLLAIPSRSLVYYEDKVCVYYLKENRFRMKNVRVLKNDGSSALINNLNLKNGYEIVTDGADILRLAFLEASGATGSGHIH